MEVDYELKEIETIRELAWELDVSVNTIYFYSRINKDRGYRDFTIPKRGGAPRKISCPPPELKKLQQAIVELFERTYKPHPSAHGGIKKHSIKTNASSHMESSWILRVDLEDFFGSITERRIFGLLKQLCANNSIAATLTNLVTYQGVLPQGAPTSPILANMVALRLDKKLSKLAKKEGLRYTRYYDDLVFSAPINTTHRFPPFSRVVAPGGRTHVQLTRIKEIIEGEEGFTINETKTRFRRRRIAQYVTGVKINEKMNISRLYVRKIRAMLHNWEKTGYKNAARKFEAETGSNTSFKVALRGYIEHMGFVRSPASPKEDELYKKYLKKFRNLQTKTSR